MIYLELLWGFRKVGFFAFGGAYGAIPLIRDVILSYGWLSDDELTYMIELKNAGISKEFIDAIRCRNGNLNIICGYESDREMM